ncbi:3-dehydroquinate dehydratase, type I [Verruconis gallopava]|uniref:3-dehydroquinate dehydratase, type I n=1 Tax=Verruconis gallopava TaxID=253628 RepID=A0A0D2AYF2_9PEZI|nr:3-dehydroquinate dehydratase, type I [Verruconis gallopava]KIW04199.1 3-dehydroquinate dehydratase, type I [Verruconis gallopava]
MTSQTTPRLSYDNTPIPVSHNRSCILSHAASPGTFAPDSSIVLIGIRGVGKSSLAVIAAKALNFQIVDADQHFQRTTGLSSASYMNSHGVKEYGLQELKVLRQILAENSTRTVIICSPSSITGAGRDLLRAFSRGHPVILVLRDADDVHRYIGVWDANAISNLVNQTSPLYRAASNFEFYNLSESFHDVSSAPNGSRNHPPLPLMLKQVERDFVHFLYQILKPADTQENHYTQHIQSKVPPESRPYTYAMLLPLSQWDLIGSQLKNVDLLVDAVEIVLDLPAVVEGKNVFDSAMASMVARTFYSVRRTLNLPLIFSINSEKLVSTNPGTSIKVEVMENVYFEIMHHALRCGPEYLSVDLHAKFDPLQIQNLIKNRGSTRIIGNFHDHSPGRNGWTEPSRRQRMLDAQELGCQIVRLSQDATSVEDNFAIRQFIQHTSESRRIPLIAYNTGKLGRFSCCVNSTLTPVTHPVLRSSSASRENDWLLTVQDCQRALYASFFLEEMYFGIYGSGILLSLSPAMHEAAYRLSGMPHSYKLFQNTSLSQLDELMGDPSFGGASITSPFKVDVVKRIQFLSPSAKAIKAVNTIIPLRSSHASALLDRNRRGPIVALYGENTDWIGIRTCIRDNLSPINAIGRNSSGLILGAGGMARAAMYAMVQLGVRKIYIFNRTREHAEVLIKQFCNENIAVGGGKQCQIVSAQEQTTTQSASFLSNTDTIEICETSIISSLEDTWSADHTPPTIIVSCIPAKDVRTGSPTNIVLRSDWLSSPTGGVVLELAYDPLETPLLKQIKALGDHKWIAVDGLHVLPEQAIAQFELFTGRKAPQHYMRKVVREGYMKQVQSGLRSLESKG